MQDKPIVGPTRGALRFPTARADLVGGVIPVSLPHPPRPGDFKTQQF